MKKRILANGNIEVSAIGLGCMGMSEFYGPSDDDQSLRTLEHAFEIGVTLYDTADTYGIGHNEELIGRFAKGKRDKIVLATKCGIIRQKGKYERRIDSSPAYIASACEASLKRLSAEAIDLFYLHRLNPDVQIEESVGALAELIGAGKIKSYGLCEVSEKTLRRAHAAHPVAALQSEYSLWSRYPEDGVLAVCRQQNTAFVAYSPLGRGFLTGKLTDKKELAEGDFRASNPRFQDENLAHNVALLVSVKKIAARLGCTAGQVALAWLLARGPDIIPIPGTRRIKYLDENVGALDVELNLEDIAVLDAVFSKDAISGERYTAEGMKGLNV
jgi:aryl-alcohol dehydrogenase-like predicted oxidoreductase